MRLEIVALYAGVNILLLLFLAFRVPGLRRKNQISLGDGGNPELLRAVRAHGNASEYIPAGLVGLLLIALMDPALPLWAVHAAGATLTLGRVLHAAGLAAGELNIGRIAGTILTFVSFLFMGVALIYAGVTQGL